MSDIFTIERNVIYDFYLTGGFKVTGAVSDVCPNGLVLVDGTRVVQAHIVMFVPTK
ncbi:hypothetical protein WJW27_002630 [Escherichia coli]|uniref:hypothetical protein n=1 Tax=Escherichia coli TaxID=562 RepID=UPI00237700F4|nr:hypothetical protein vBEcoMphAPEC6_01940 [Escherichia phage ph0011]